MNYDFDLHTTDGLLLSLLIPVGLFLAWRLYRRDRWTPLSAGLAAALPGARPSCLPWRC